MRLKRLGSWRPARRRVRSRAATLALTSVMSNRSEIAGFGALLCETGRAWRHRLDQRLKPLGLSQTKWVALLKLSHAETDMTQKELAERLGIEGPSLVSLLDRMAAEVWIERRGSHVDRRSKTVHLRAKSCAVLEQIDAVAVRLRSELLEGIPPAKLRACMEVLRQIKEAASRHQNL